MRVIIIEDKDAKALLVKLNERRLAKQEFLGSHADEFTINDVHRMFHYEVCSWLQEQGCKVT